MKQKQTPPASTTTVGAAPPPQQLQAAPSSTNNNNNISTSSRLFRWLWPRHSVQPAPTGFTLLILLGSIIYPYSSALFTCKCISDMCQLADDQDPYSDLVSVKKRELTRLLFTTVTAFSTMGIVYGGTWLIDRLVFHGSSTNAHVMHATSSVFALLCSGFMLCMRNWFYYV